MEGGEWRSSLTSLLRPLEVKRNGMEDEVCVPITPLPLFVSTFSNIKIMGRGEEDAPPLPLSFNPSRIDCLMER